jgi:hypothetical protein
MIAFAGRQEIVMPKNRPAGNLSAMSAELLNLWRPGTVNLLPTLPQS